MESWLIWSLVLFGAGLFVAVLEVIVPSGGLLALAAIACLVGSLASAYQHSGVTLAIMALVEGVCVPVVIVLAFKILPKTSVGRQLFLSPPSQTEGDPGRQSPPQGEGANFDNLLGTEGVVVTALRPSGTAEISGQRVSVVSNGEAIADGSRVRVVLVEGNRVVVETVGATSEDTGGTPVPQEE